jgi:DNA mismatch repair protein MSH5
MSQSSSALPTLPQQKRRPFQPLAAASSSGDNSLVQAFDEETEADLQLREDSDAMNEIIMAVDMKERGTIGCAYYIAREEKLCLMEDIKMGGLGIIDTLKLHAQPTVVLISTRSDEVLEEYLSKEARGIDRGDDASTFNSRTPPNRKVLTKVI